MKARFEILMTFALLFVPVCAHSASPAQPDQSSQISGDSAVTTNPVANPASNPPVMETRNSDMQFPVFRTIGGLGLVICLMVGGFFAARKFAPRYFNKPASERNLKILETLAMGDRRSISLIEVANSRFLVGNTPQQINLLAALPEPISLVSEPHVVSTSPKSANKKGVNGGSFRNLFEVEKIRPAQYAGNPLPEDLRTKMRQLRDALERS